MLIRTSGNCLNWDVVAYLPQVCTDCGEEELRRILDGENEDLDDCTCEGHTLCYFPAETLDEERKILEGLLEGKKIDELVPWYILHDTNGNFAAVVGEDIPKDVLVPEAWEPNNDEGTG